MRVLILAGTEAQADALREVVGDVPWTSEKDIPEADLLVSFGYRHILRDLSVPAVNIHISMLPWNRGADPNFWSWLDHTPKGVTIHLMDQGIDTGPIIAQREVAFGFGQTLRSTYETLAQSAVRLFAEEWPWIRNGWYTATPQPKGGAYHRKKDMEPWKPRLTQGWDTPIYEIESLRG